MAENQLSNEQLLKMMLSDQKEREKALHYIFNNREWQDMVKYHVIQNRGNEQDVDDVFQETMIIFDRQLRAGSFQGGSSLKTFFMSIAKWHWLGELRKKKPQQEFSVLQHDSKEESVEITLIKEEKKNFLSEALKQIGARCKEILELYKLQYSMQEIADQLSFSTAELAKKETYRCRMKMREFFKTNPEWHNRVK